LARQRDLDPLLVIARRRRGRRARRSRRVPIVVKVLLVLVVLGAVAIAGLAIATPHLIASQCTLQTLRPITLGENSFVTATDGSLLGAIPSVRNRQPISLRQISKWLPAATVAIEDRRFWHHGALDYRAIARAALADLKAGRTVEGASTLTMQLARNLYIGSDQHSFRRKLTEACLATKLSERMTRRQILAMYLNVVFYGNHAFGAEAASQTYFSRHARELTLPQAALLAGLVQAPSTYDPLSDADAARLRRGEVLRAMLKNHQITRAQYVWAVHSPLGLRPGNLYKTHRQPYFFSYVERQLVDRYGVRVVAAGGLHVRTTIDPKLERLALDSMWNILRSKRDPASALVAIDPRNGKVRAMAVYVPSGQRLQFNLATQGHRQAGSAFKPMTLAAALERGLSLNDYYSGPPQLTINDRRCLNGINTPWDVHNYADESAGTMSLLDATVHSVNTIYAQVVSKVGPDAVVRMAHRLGITSPLKAVCSITLGTQAVSPLEMTSAYATFAAHGVRHDPTALEHVVGPSGKWLPSPASPGKQAVSSQVADTVSYALYNVIQRGTGTAANIGRPAAGKTGTAENYVDGWFCGYVPQLAACVWIGYPHREVPLLGIEGVPEVFGGSLPAEIWQRFMSQALQGVPVPSVPSQFGSQPVYPSTNSYPSTTTGYTNTTPYPSTNGNTSTTP
jgi:penicillin-binding protein 1A